MAAPRKTRSARARPLRPLAYVCLPVAVLLVVLLGVTGTSSSAPPIPKYAKVRVAKGPWQGTLGVVVRVRRRAGKARRYRVRLAGGTVRTFRRPQLRRLRLAAGDAVEVVSGRRKGRSGVIARVRPRRTGRGKRVRRRFVVAFPSGRRARFSRRQLAYVPPAAWPTPRPPDFGRPACTGNAVRVSVAAQIRLHLAAGRDVCIAGDLGDVDLSGIRPGRAVSIGTAGGSLGAIRLFDASDITLRARFTSVEIGRASRITINQSIVGGTNARRVPDQLIFISATSHDIAIRDSDIGWTTADNSGNTGYGLRVHGTGAGLRVERNRFHHLGGDGIQGFGDSTNVVIDRNEFAYIAPPLGSDEHADDIQVVGHGPGLRITNNYLHHNGYLDAGGPNHGGSGPYIHAGDSGAALFANNLVRHEQNFMQVGNLGTGGCEKSNLTFRRNTFYDNGQIWEGSPDLSWRLCGGSGNRYEANVVNDNFGNEFGFGASGTTASRNLHGPGYRIAANGNCTSPACNPAGAEPIGFRKPSGVHW